MDVIFDLDGTLSLNHWRSQLYLREKNDEGKWVRRKKPNWDEYGSPENVAKDEPNRPVVDVARTLCRNGYAVHVWSARMASPGVYEATVNWLAKYGVHFRELRMRADGDSQEDSLLKETWLKQGFLNYGRKPFMVDLGGGHRA